MTMMMKMPLLIDDDDDVLVVEEAPSKQKTKSPSSKKKAASTKFMITTLGTARKLIGRKAPSRRKRLDDSNDDEVEYLGKSANLDVDWGSAATKRQHSQWS